MQITKRIAISYLAAAASLGMVSAQSSQPVVDIYTTPSSNGTNVYVTGVMQIDMAESAFCQEHVALCTSAIHTYTQTVTIKSPSGRTGSCTFSSKYPAIDTEDLQCEATLAIEGEIGLWPYADQQEAVCTIAGTFLDQDTTGGGGSSISFGIDGNAFIFVGTASQIVAANTFYAMNSSLSGNPQPSGGTLSAKSSNAADTVTIKAGTAPTAQFTTTAQSTNPNDRTLTFAYTVPDGTATASKNVTARGLAYLTNNDPSDQCSLEYGTVEDFIYQIYTLPDNAEVIGAALTGTPVTETFSPSLTCQTISGNGGITDNAQIIDHIASACSSQPLTCSQTTTQSLFIANSTSAIRKNKLVWGSDGVTYTNLGPNPPGQ